MPKYNTLIKSNIKVTRNYCLLKILQYFGVTKETLCAKTRITKFVHRRYIAAYILRKYTNASLPQIAQMLGHKDHTTIIHALEAVEEECFTETLNKAVDWFEENLKID